MQQFLDNINQSVIELTEHLNEETKQYNLLVEQADQLEEENHKYEAKLIEADSVLKQQGDTLIKATADMRRAATRIQQLTVTNKELIALDPKRLNKVNKVQKKSLAELKVKIAEIEKQRKTLLAENKKLTKEAQNLGSSFFYIGDDNNGIKVNPNVYVAKNNTFNGVVGSPVIEFTHHLSGVSRQGVLTHDGSVQWSSAKNSLPTKLETKIAEDKLITFCKAKGIKV